MPKMFRRFLANDPRLLTGIGIREQNRIRVDGSKTGTMLYGPYIMLFPGQYEATVKFDPGITPKGSATLDVCVDTGREILATRTFDAEQLWQQNMNISLAFSCGDLVRRAEVRLKCPSEFVAAVQSVQITGEFTSSQGGGGFTTGDLPLVNVRNEINRGRNPYDGYQRGLGLAIPGVAEKLKMDLDFQEALQVSGGRTIVGENNLANIFMIIKLFLPRLPFGHIVEFGSFRGGSALFMALVAQKFLPNAQILAFDTFSGMPPTDKAVDLHNAGDFQGVDLPELRQYVEEIGLRNLHFVQGKFEDTASHAVKEIQKVALCHIDCDIRSAIQSAYDTTRQYMVPGGYWVFDDPLQPTCLGATEAVEDLLIRRDSLNAEQVWPHPVFRQPFAINRSCSL
jgi:Macrocin-O-methyltransferase (TylF)